ncbi:MAG: DUF4838 domain-containing protein [Verrucomicrobiae bacterium]|nr:DUF4838 domain-containing protein [Verrucomicrobiae bacterium]
MKKTEHGILFFGLLMAGVFTLGWCGETSRELLLTSRGASEYVIAVDRDGAPSDRFAAEELASVLCEVSGAKIPVVAPSERGARPCVAVGFRAAQAVAPQLAGRLPDLGRDGICQAVEGKNLILTGGKDSRRGTVYAVYNFLEETVGCRWWTAQASYLPKKTEIRVAPGMIQHIPPFEYREPFFYEVMDAKWAARNKCNGRHYKLTEEMGGGFVYVPGFAHTFGELVPGAMFKEHPEWFSEINGKRVGPPQATQLCLTNGPLLEYCIQRIREKLKTAPPDAIVSVTQNDHGGNSRCLCARCKAVEDEEGSPSGPVLRFVNAIAQALEKEYPLAIFDTFAYLYTRQPPRLVRPRPNVCVRLCSIECNFLFGLDHPSNQTFANDLKNWFKIAKRLYIWDYCTNFSHYPFPFPDLRALAPNVRLFKDNGVQGVFEQGSCQSKCGDLSELKAWVLARLLWNPALDDKALVKEFVNGYYGAAGPWIEHYINRLYDAAIAAGKELTIYAFPMEEAYGFLDYATVRECGDLLEKAVKAVENQPDFLKRARIVQAGLRYAMLLRWPVLEQEAWSKGEKWPGIEGVREVCRDLDTVFTENAVTHVSEATLRYDAWRPILTLPRTAPVFPKVFEGLARNERYDLQDYVLRIYDSRPHWGSGTADDKASDGVAVWLETNHQEWVVQVKLPTPVGGEKDMEAKWTVWAAVRGEGFSPGNDPGFAHGIHADRNAKIRRQGKVALNEIRADQYRLYRVADLTGAQLKDAIFWLAPCKNPDKIRKLWVDRVLVTRSLQELEGKNVIDPAAETNTAAR